MLSAPLVKKVLSMKNVAPDPDAYYLYANYIEMIWPYDDTGRLIGENVWEPEPEKAEIIKLDPANVVTVAEAAERLAPYIKQLPSFHEMVGKNAA